MKVEQNADALAIHSSRRVIEVDSHTDPRWEMLVKSIPATPSPIYHPAWLMVQEEAYGHKSIHLACEDASGQLVGILPLFSRRGWCTGRHIISVYTDPLVYNDQTRASLLQAAVERTRTESGAQLHLKVMPNPLDDLVSGLIAVPAYETYILTLPERPDLLHLLGGRSRRQPG